MFGTEEILSNIFSVFVRICRRGTCGHEPHEKLFSDSGMQNRILQQNNKLKGRLFKKKGFPQFFSIPLVH
jgi:hypothetical protein